MIKTIYKCDCCGKEWNSESKEEQICTVTLSIRFGSTQAQTKSYPDFKHHWCRSCVISKGVHEPITPEDKKIAPPILSFEEKFVELLNSMGFPNDTN